MGWLPKNIDYASSMRVSDMRKLLILTFKKPEFAKVSADVEIDAGPALAYVKQLRRGTGVPVTLNHFLMKVVALSVKQTPEMNYVLRLGKFYRRNTIDISFLISLGTEEGLVSMGKVRCVDQLSLPELVNEVRAQSERVRQGGIQSIERFMRSRQCIPGFALKWSLSLLEFLLYSLNVWIPAFGLPRDGFGSVLVDNVGFLGVDNLRMTPPRLYRAPLFVVMGSVRRKPVEQDGGVQIAPILGLSITFDHRYIDGPRMARWLKFVKLLFAHPEKVNDTDVAMLNRQHQWGAEE